MIREIATETHQDEQLHRLNWAVSAYASSLRALTRSGDMAQLMTSVCRAIVGNDRYALCWIGLIDASPQKKLHIGGAAGPAIGYMSGLELSASDTVVGGQGPTGIALRSGLPVVMRDSLSDPDFAPWRQKAAQYGIRSSVTVPFHQGVLGAVSVYAMQPDAFGPSELSLFSQLGEEIAFGMSLAEERIRTKVSQESAERAESAMREERADFFRISRIAALGEFSAVIAHEISQPLASIMTNSDACQQWLEHDPPDVDEAKLALRGISRNVERATEIVRRVRLLFSKEEQPFVAFDINASIEEVLRFLDRELHRAHVVLQTGFAVDAPKVWGDRIQVQQVVANLIMNASEAMRTVDDRQRLMRVNTRTTEAGSILVEVKDAGVGIDPIMHEKLFERFFSTKPSGMGLGLATSRAIIASHGGHLWATADSPFGATFQFTLPMASP